MSHEATAQDTKDPGEVMNLAWEVPGLQQGVCYS